MGSLDAVRGRAKDLPTLGRAISPLVTRAVGALVSLARSFKPDIVHTHLAKAGAVGRVAARLAGVRVVVHTYHGSVFRGYFGQRESAVYLQIERALARITTRIVAITAGQKADLVSLGIAPSAKIVEIPLGLDLEHFRELPARDDALAALGLQSEMRYVTIVARLVAIKDIPTFVRALSRVTDSHPDVRGLVVGDGPDRAAIEGVARELGLGDRCRFLGWRADLPNVYAASDVVALSSLNEGSPVSLIEAMAAGRAVVATAVGGVPDLVHDGAGIPRSRRSRASETPWSRCFGTPTAAPRWAAPVTISPSGGSGAIGLSTTATACTWTCSVVERAKARFVPDYTLPARAPRSKGKRGPSR